MNRNDVMFAITIGKENHSTYIASVKWVNFRLFLFSKYMWWKGI